MNFGDGSPVATSSTPTFAHTYQFPGTYIVQAQAKVGTTTHDNLRSLLVVTISTSYLTNTNGTQPTVNGLTLSNTSSSVGPTGVLATGGTLTVQGWYSANATAIGYALVPPTITASCGTSCVASTLKSFSGFPGVQATVTFATAGIYTVTFNGGSQSGTTVAAQNYVWTAYVSSPAGAAQVAPLAKSPHPGKLIVYENAPGGGTSTDPALDYETVGYEVLQSVLEPLVTYNGTTQGPYPSQFVPVVAACVPGTTTGGGNCMSMFGSTLYSGTNWTFVISASRQFYDPATGGHWGIYPTDVVFSEVRAMTLANSGKSAAGWINAQALLPTGNPAYQGGLHFPYNNTPKNSFANMIINGSACPTIATTSPLYHGCVTFNANGAAGLPNGPLSWSTFLDFMAIQSTGAIVPCGWFSAVGGGLNYWTTNVTGSGDHPCGLPGSPGYGNTVATMPDNAWNSFFTAFFLTNYPCGNSPVTCVSMVGSGPYYLANYVVGTSYTLKANPFYTANPACTWTYVNGVNACFPAANSATVNSYAKEVDVVWETDVTPGLQGMQAGVVDFAGYHGSTQTALALQYIQSHKAVAAIGPTLSVDFWPFNFAFNKVKAAAYPTGPITVPSDWFSYLGMRQLFATAWPYATSQSQFNTVSGIQYGILYGGMIPVGMANYYPQNISWPSTDPVLNYASPLSPAYWWAQLTKVGGPYYDPEAAACSAASPCQLPLFLQTGAPALDSEGALQAQSIKTFTNGSVIVHALDINFGQLVANSLGGSAYSNPMPYYRLGWAPDYSVPDDYLAPMYFPDSTYTFSDTVQEQTHLAAFNKAGCSTSAIFYAHNGVNNSCQGAAYDAMNALSYAAYSASPAQQVVLYNIGEHIANSLGLYIYTVQVNNVWLMGPWVNPNSIDQQVTIGGGNDIMWCWLNGNGVAG